VSGVIVRDRGLLDPEQTLAVQQAKPTDGFGRCEALIIVDHDRDIVADRLADSPDDRHVLLYRRIADVSFHALESLFGPFQSGLGGDRWPVESHCTIGRDRSRGPAK
jgi:hypothetical protein